MKKIKIYYEGSGVKTLSGFATLSYILGSIGTCVSLILLLTCINNSSDREVGIAVISVIFPVSIFLFCFGGICSGVSSIARTALYKRLVLEQEYEFYEEEHIISNQSEAEAANNDSDVNQS
jgi:hypothetical protein